VAQAAGPGDGSGDGCPDGLLGAEDPDVRANLPRYSNWPTFPQLFIHGELIGGCDITMELYESGELDRLVKDTQKA